MAYKAVTISAGEHTWLPRGVNVISVTVDGEAEIESSCLDFSQVGGLVCWDFPLNTNDDNQKAYDRIVIGEETYLFTSVALYVQELVARISEILPQNMFKIDYCPKNPGTVPDHRNLLLQLPPGLPAPMLGFSDNFGGGQGMEKNRGFMIADAGNDCESCPE